VKNITWVYVISIIFIAVNAILVAKEFFYINLIPIILLFLLLAFLSLDRLLLLIVFLTPISIPLKEIVPNLEVDLYLPTEPLLLLVMIIFFLKLASEEKFDKKVLLHPISIIIYFYLIWILITCITSSIPLVSFKFLITRLWFIIGFYFLATQLFSNIKRVKQFFWLYIIPLLGVIGYSIIRLSGYGLINQEAAHFVVNPFYNDHTAYGAILAMFIPVLFGFAFSENRFPFFKLIIWGLIAIFLFALVLSYTRAAWVSLLGAFGVLMIILLKIKFRTVFILSAVLVTLLFIFRTDIRIFLEKNRQESSTELTEHIQSISNIASDASNLERINRWKSALRMFKEKPLFGWGPGTYIFKYAPFQFSHEKTIISTNRGNMGNAHSEYIGPLAESGVLGMVTFILIVGTTIFTGLKVYSKTKDKTIRIISLTTLLGLMTYFIHGLLNNFLDTDKASVPFWGFIAIIVSLDIYQNNRGKGKILREKRVKSKV